MTSPIQETLRKFKDDKYTDAEVDAIVLTHKGDASAHHTKTISAEIDHTLISNIGTNSHSQIDTAVTNSVAHIADNTQAHSDYMLNTGDTASGDYNFDSNTLFIDASASRVGIGTTSPGAKLEVNENISNWATRIYQAHADGWGLVVDVNNEDTDKWALGIKSGATYKFVVKNDGNVGIGTVSPNENLEIFDDAGAYLRFSGIVGGVGEDAGGIEWYQSRGGTTGVISKIHVERGGYSYVGGELVFSTSENDDLTERMRIDDTGNVGIGTTSPNEALTLGADGVLSIDERATAPSNTAAHGKLWVKNTVPTELWFTDDAGTSTKIV